MAQTATSESTVQKRGKSEVGADGKTKHQRYVERHKEKVYTANALRNGKRIEEERRKKAMESTRTIKDAVGKEVIGGGIEGGLSNEKELNTELIATFDRCQALFDKWDTLTISVLKEINARHNMQLGWHDEIPYVGSLWDKLLTTQKKEGLILLKSIHCLLRDLSCNLNDGHSWRWDKTLDMVSFTTIHLAAIDRIEGGFDIGGWD